MHRKSFVGVLVLPLLLTPKSGRAQRDFDLAEASGIVTKGDEFIIVSDSEPGAFFRLPMPRSRLPFTIIPSQVTRVVLPNAALALDLEEVDVLVDGRVVVLSERLRALIAENGNVLEYDDPFGEIAESGLEGLAVASGSSVASSRVAALWEGGYLRASELPASLGGSIGNRALKPVVVVHDLAAGALGQRQRMRDTRPTDIITLDIPVPRGKEPAAQRFRAPDLVWHRADEGQFTFIVLLSSFSVKPEKYQHLWLQRFDARGKPHGSPIDIDAIAPPNLRGRNWEGLAWVEFGKTLALIDDISSVRRNGPPTVLFIDLPAAWTPVSKGLAETGARVPRRASQADRVR